MGRDKKSWRSKAYDDSPQYRFLYQLRSFMQHGHLSVSVFAEEDGSVRCCFDLAQILNTPHINIKESVREEFQAFMEKMRGQYNSLYMAYVPTLVLYHAKILELYCQYLDIIDSAIENICKNCDDFIAANRQVLFRPENDPKEYVSYILNDTIHTFPLNPNFYSEEFSSAKDFAYNELSIAQKEVEILRQSSSYAEET